MTAESAGSLLVLRRSELEPLMQPRQVIDALETAFRAAAKGQAHVPRRSAVPGGNGGVMLVMPASSAGVALGAKIVTFYPNNRATGHPTHIARRRCRPSSAWRST